MGSGLGTNRRPNTSSNCVHIPFQSEVLDCSLTLCLRLFSTPSAALLKSLAFVNVYVNLYSWFHGDILCDFFN